jgi:cyclophilin family peptidyl-prolyl cis-trans isomerase
MKQLFSLFMLFLSVSAFATTNPSVVMDTSKGQIIIELFPQQAPKTVANFLAYIEKDGYKQTTFHRVIKNFMIQGGGFKASGKKADLLPPIENESNNGLSNQRGTISMARTNNPHSATRQFFINHKDNPFLDIQNKKWGYAVFGKVTSGMKVVDEIATVKTGFADKPRQPVIINSISLQKKQTEE